MQDKLAQGQSLQKLLDERDIQIFNKGVATLINDQQFVPVKYWPLTAFHWLDVRNRTPNVSTGNLSPLEVITKEKTKISNQFMLKFWGVVCVPVVTPNKIWRFVAKNDIAIYIGQSDGVVGGGRVSLPWDRRVLVRGSLSKVTAHIDELIIGLEFEMKWCKTNWRKVNYCRNH